MDVLRYMHLIVYCLKYFRKLDFNDMAIVQMLILFNIVSDVKKNHLEKGLECWPQQKVILS